MNIKKAISLAKGNDEERVGFNLKIPKTLKSEFEHFCKENDVSVTAMILALMRTVLDEELKDSKNENSIVELQKSIMEMNKLIDFGVDETDIGFNPYVVKMALERKFKILAGMNPDEE